MGRAGRTQASQVIVNDLRAAYRYAIESIACSRGQVFRYGVDWTAEQIELEESVVRYEMREIRRIRAALAIMEATTYGHR